MAAIIMFHNILFGCFVEKCYFRSRPANRACVYS